VSREKGGKGVIGLQYNKVIRSLLRRRQTKCATSAILVVYYSEIMIM